MIEYLITFAGVYFFCLFKFIAGPILGSAAGFSLFEIILVTVSGMMTSVVAFTFLGEWIKNHWSIRFKKKNKIFSSKTRRIVRIWQKFGIPGIAILTPVLFTPIGGTIIMVSFGVKKRIILLYMFISACIWATIFGLTADSIMDLPFFLP